MLGACLLMGFAVICIAVWLEYNDSLGWPREIDRERGLESESDLRYRAIRRRWRVVTHAILATCGFLMAAAGFAGLGKFWVASWTAVAILIMAIMVIALGDAIRTHRHYASKMQRRK